MSEKISQIPISFIDGIDNKLKNFLNIIYPIGSIYISITESCPIQDLGVGTWELISQDRVLQGAGTRGAVGTTLNESLPNITGALGHLSTNTSAPGIASSAGALKWANTDSCNHSRGDKEGYGYDVTFDASRSSSTYQDNAPVQQDAYLVNIWKRVS